MTWFKTFRFGLLAGALCLAAPVAAEDPPSVDELITWVGCLKSEGGISSTFVVPNALEAAFGKCVRQEEVLRAAISNDPRHDPEYTVTRMKEQLRAQQQLPQKLQQQPR